MKISLQWLKDYVQMGISKESLAHKLTMAGLEVEAISSVGADTVFELEITPNRADCLSMVGMAREVSAILDKTLKNPKIPTFSPPTKKISIDIEDKKDCQTYLGTVIEGISIAVAPAWMTEKISALGIRPISNLVDITNFCLMELGQPLHAFDYDKLKGGKIIVRRAKKGEKIVTIDDEERELDPSILVIADAERPVAIAGIMGGKDTEVTSSTKNILLESAYFDPILTRRASRKLGLSSDSSYRFERGVDIAGVGLGSRRAIGLILDLAGGKITHHKVAGSDKPKKQKPVAITLDQINSYLGTELSVTKVKTILKQLNFSVSSPKKNSLSVIAPSSRKDIQAYVDIIEEIARIIGYDNLPESLPNIKASSIQTSPQWSLRCKIRELMLAQGLSEAISFSLLNRNDLPKSNLQDKNLVAITNPLSLDQEILQPSTLPSMLSVVKINLNRGQKDIRLFETARIYLPNGEEHETLSVIMTGSMNQDWRMLKKQKVNCYDIKGVYEQTLRRLGIDHCQYTLKKADHFEDDYSLAVTLDKKEIGTIGLVKDDVLDKWNIKSENIYFGQILIPHKKTDHFNARQYKPVSSFPAITRDISLAVNQATLFQDISDLAYREGGQLLKNVTFMEEYLGDKIPSGKRGIIFSLVYQSSDRTLTEEQVNDVHQKILKSIVEKYDATIR